jgi:DNA-binding NarL/FixJ family response regulator
MKELGTAFIGRERECGEIERLILDAHRGDSGCLVVRGEPGIGKTALLDYAARLAGAATVLRAGGADAESDLAFAGIHGLLRPILGKLDQLAGPQRQALAGALGLAESPGQDRLFISAAVLGLLAAAAEDHLVVCLVDDAQWLDSPSAGALVFAARRLRAERVVMLFAAREGEPCAFQAQGLPELFLGGLPAPAAGQLVDRAAPNVAPAVRERLLAEGRGNPLALLELPGGLTAAQLSGRAPLSEAIPLTPRLRRVFRDRIEDLPGPARLALVVAAAEDTGDAAAVLRAADRLNLPADALEAAELAGLIRADGGAFLFRHPLVRSAAYEAAPLSQRQRAHAALADALPGEHEADRRIWHQAMAAAAGDEQVAAALEASARRAQQRAGHASAATAFERAAALTLDESQLVPRLTAAAQAAWDAGQAERSRALIARTMSLADGHDRARLLYQRAVIESVCGSIERAVATQLEGAGLSDDPSLTTRMLHQAAEGAVDRNDQVMLREIGARLATTPAKTRRDQLSRAVVLGLVALFNGEHEQARAAFDDALARVAAFNDDPQAQLWAVNAAWLDADLGAGLAFATRAVDLTRAQGRLSLLPAALNQQSRELLRNSSFTQAYAAAEEGCLLSADLGQGWGWLMNTMACVEAIWGREADARQHAEQVLAYAPVRSDTGLTVIARATLGFLELTMGRPTEAARVFQEIPAENQPALLISPLISLPDADTIEAIVRAGQPPEHASAPLARIRTTARLLPTMARRSVLARCEALLEKRPPGEAFTEALSLAAATPPFERARTELLYGEWLRRQRNRTQARSHLRAAADLFRTLGADPWAQRAEAELRAAGEAARTHKPAALEQLTPQELKIAELVAGGLTNRDIAAHLFLSPRTIDYHLRKVFTKLGITSRGELIRRAALRRNPG